MLTESLKTQLANYIAQLEEAHPHSGFHYTVGKKYIRIVEDWLGGQQSSFCFVDFQGNLYKAESWAKPALGIRGHIDRPILTLGGFYR
jgi:hypothetical protein